MRGEKQLLSESLPKFSSFSSEIFLYLGSVINVLEILLAFLLFYPESKTLMKMEGMKRDLSWHPFRVYNLNPRTTLPRQLFFRLCKLA